MKNHLSLKWKLLAPMAVILILIMTMVNLYSAQQQKARLLRITEQQLHDILNGYLDSMNTLMFTGTMANRELLRQKLEQREEVLEVRMLRADSVSKTFGPGFDNEKPKDQLDQRALQGENITLTQTIDSKRQITVIEPFKAVADRNGTNCLTCHQVPEGTVLGAARITYSLEQRDNAINQELLFSSAINFLVMVAGLILIYLIMFRVVIKPLKKLKKTMETIGKNADLRPRIPLGARDEFYQVAVATNKMLNRFQPTIRELAQTTYSLNDSADTLEQVTAETQTGVEEQLRESEHLALSTDKLANAANQVAENAANAEQAANTAKTNADNGKNMVIMVGQAIKNLSQQVQEATGVVEQLAQDTQGIGQVSQTIADIAEQTNLLALNAAIEAARAGEQGRGFAVVADEVRSLATRTQESTEEIKSIIERLVTVSEQAVRAMDSSRSQAEKSVDDSNQAGSALEEIASGVDTIRQMNAAIASSAAEQSQVVNTINQNVHAISTVSQQTAQGSTRTMEHSDKIATIAKQLDQLVNQFKFQNPNKD